MSCNTKINNEEKFSLETLQDSVFDEFYHGLESYNTTYEMILDKTNPPKLVEKTSMIFNQLKTYDSLVNLVFISLNELRVQKPSPSAKVFKSCIHKIDYSKVSTDMNSISAQKIEQLIKSILAFNKNSIAFIDSSHLYQKEYMRNEVKIRTSKIEGLSLKKSLSSNELWIKKERILLSIAKKILECRTIIFQNVFYEIGCIGSYRFSHIKTIVDGPKIGNIGDTMKFEIFTAAMDRYNDPIISSLKNASLIKVQDGVAYINFIPQKKGKQIISGEISFKNKSGIVNKSTWSDTIEVK